MAEKTVVERELQLNLVLSPEHSVEVPARLRYLPADPYAVHVTFHVGSPAPVDWTFSRELLVEGASRPCGQGDVRVWPATMGGRDVICVALASPDGEALLEAPSSQVTSWLERTLRIVPPGSEHERLGMDDELATLLTAAVRDDLQLHDPWSGAEESPDSGV